MPGRPSPARLSRGAGAFLLAACAALVLGGTLGVVLLGRLVVEEWRARHRYVRTACTVLDKRAGESGSGREGDETHYRPEIRIRYRVAGTEHDIWTYDASGLYTGVRPKAILDRFRVGGQFPCWYDPDDPGKAVLVRDYHPFAYLMAIVPIGMIAAGVVGVSEVSRALRHPARPPRPRRPKAPPRPSGPSSAGRGSRLPVRLARTTSWSRQRGCSLALGLLLTGFVAVLGALIAPNWSEESVHDRVGMAVVLGGFGLVGVLLLYSAAHQALAAFVAETIVEVDRMEVGQGETVRVCFLQPGPVALRSLRATLVRKQTEPLAKSREKESYEFGPRFLDVGDLRVRRGETLERVVELKIPSRAIPTGLAGEVRTEWLIEVWGRVRSWPGFMHRYEIVVSERRRGKRNRGGPG